MSQIGGNLPAGRQAFFTSVGCMDGRVQDPVSGFGRQKFGVLYVDTITEAGLVGKLSKDQIEQNFLESLKSKILISLEKHHSKGIIVHGHEDCAASDAVDEETHKNDIIKSVEVIKSLVNTSVPIIAAYVKRQDCDWVVEEIPQTAYA